jgi:hypothetical protein
MIFRENIALLSSDRMKGQRESCAARVGDVGSGCGAKGRRVSIGRMLNVCWRSGVPSESKLDLGV